MAVVEKTTIGYGSRLGSSLKGIFTGILMVLAGIVLLWWNEGRSVRRYKALKEGASNVISISADQVLPENEGKLVHLTAPAVTQETLQDSDFGLALPGALRLERKVEMYQWEEQSETREEEKLGGKVEKTTTYTYEKVWSSTLVDSRNFKEPGHENPARLLVPGKTVVPARVTVGAFRLTPEQIRAVGGAREMEFAADYQVPEMPASLLQVYQAPRVSQREIYFPVKRAKEAQAGEDAPEIGDIRVSFQVVDSHDISLVYVQKGDSFAVYQAKTGTVALQADGIKTADEMFTSAQNANKMITWLLRLAGFLLLFIGFQTIFKPIQVLASVLPFLGRMVGAGTSAISFLLALPISLLVIALAWLFYRPVLAIVLLLAVAASLYGLKSVFAKLKKPEAPAQG
ncbi:MAG: TMEM43 family protein [Oligosphaeraceae bacterium]